MNTNRQSVEFRRPLIRKYDQPLPRYTSYPTAPHFQESFGIGEYGELLDRSRESGRPLSLYVHVPFCSVRCFFCGCHTKIGRAPERAAPYLKLLDREMELTAARLGADERAVEQIHWGGGTPTFLSADELSQLMQSIRRHFQIADGCEIGVEVDPRECTAEQLDALAEAGVNRLSLGIQDLSPEVQKAINRFQTAEETWAVLEGARRRGMDSVNVDLIYGLPEQTVEGFSATLDAVIERAPDRLAVFNFAYLPQIFRHHKAIDADALPDPETKLTLLETTIERLTGAGYVFIGMDHFAKREDPLTQALFEGSLTRNFQGYSTHADADLVGFGVSSISQVADGYAQNRTAIPDYQTVIDRDQLATFRGLELDADDHLRRGVIMDLMCRLGVDKSAVEAAHAIDFDATFERELTDLAPLEADGLVQIRPDRLEVTPAGRLMIRNIAAVFDTYLRRESGVRYSRAV
jgi:oxygen-independent coproporphyrinogen-3 oxidase